MAPKVEEKILQKLDHIEKLLINVIPQKTELTEDEVLDIIEEGDRELREGELGSFEDFIDKEYPEYAKKNKGKTIKSV